MVTVGIAIISSSYHICCQRLQRCRHNHHCHNNNNNNSDDDNNNSNINNNNHIRHPSNYNNIKLSFDIVLLTGSLEMHVHASAAQMQ